MNVFIRTPYSITKNLGEAYNYEMSLIPDGGAACFIDGDVQFLTPDYGNILHEYANRNKEAGVLTCYTNRIHRSSPQLLNGVINEDPDIRNHIKIAEAQKKHLYEVEPISIMSGFLMIIRKDHWKEFPFNEEIGLLGVDSEYRKMMQHFGKEILLMRGLYCWHSYRIGTSTDNKQHLLI